jgi:hypothetical protein
MKGLSGFTGYVDDARDALERHFMANGWIVTRLSGAAANDSEFMRVVQDPATAAVGFIGHADTGAIMWDSGLTEAHNVPDVKTLHGGLEEVILLGCKAGRAEYKSGVGLARFADRLVVNPAAQFVASEYSLAPWDLSRIAKEVETKSPLSDVDTVPSFLTRVCFTIQNIFGADRTLPEAPKIDIHATPIMPDISPVGWAEMRMAEQYMMMGISPPAK